MKPSCPRTSSVEALTDGRLTGEGAEAMRLHVNTCPSCATEAARLAALTSALRTLREDVAHPLQVAAGRTRLLEAAARGETHAARRPTAFGTYALALAACVALGFGLSSAYRHFDAAEGARAAAANPADALELRVTATPSASWTRSTAPNVERLSLREGGLDIAVKRHGANRRLVVTLPDGELEDEGTVFSVRVREGRTEQVAVESGRVALRLQGMAEQHLGPGESFHAAPRPAPSAEPASEPAVTPSAEKSVAAPPEAPAPTTPAAHQPASSPATHATGAPSSAKLTNHSTAAVDDAAACPGAPAFEDCVEAFRRGSYAEAAALLERFSRSCSRHAEDAAYLRMVALARAGQKAEARAQASRYLERFPHGFRRKEAEQLAGGE